MMANAEGAMGLRIALLSDWRVSASAADSPDVDEVPVVTAEGLPLLPGRTLRGLLRDALDLCAEAAAKGEAEQIRAVTRWAFGTAIDEPVGSGDMRLAFTEAADAAELADQAEAIIDARRLLTQPGNLRVDSAELGWPERRDALRRWAGREANKDALAFAFRRVASTRINAETGTANDGSLRAARVCVPMVLRSRLWPSGEQSPPPGWRAVIAAALPLIAELGSQRTRGFGRVQIQVEELPDTPAAAASRSVEKPENSAWLAVDLLEDVIVNKTTSAGAEVAEGLPGATLLGVAARCLYERLGADAYRVFHAGAVRFGDATASADGEPAWPAPLALHTRKGDLTPLAAQNLASPERPDGQWQPLGGAIRASDGLRIGLATHTSMRTAISKQGTARPGLLYTLQALARGQRLMARIDSDDDQLLAQVIEALDGQRVRIGRSRGAEYGTCRLSRVAKADEPKPIATASIDATTDAVVVWCLADCCLADEVGAPRLRPAPEDVGLPQAWRLSERRSHIRARRYSPFNGKRGRPAMEREVIVAGSVFVFERPQGAPPAEDGVISNRCGAGIGLYRSEGLGRVSVQPQLLQGADVAVRGPLERRLDEPASADEVAVPDLAEIDEICRWRALAAAKAARAALHEDATRCARLLAQFRMPKAQLGALRSFAMERSALDTAAFKAQLLAQFGARPKAPAPARDPGTERAVGYDEDNKKRVRDHKRGDKASGGNLQRQRWLKRHAGKQAIVHVLDALDDATKQGRLLEVGQAAHLVALIAERTAKQVDGGEA